MHYGLISTCIVLGSCRPAVPDGVAVEVSSLSDLIACHIICFRMKFLRVLFSHDV